MRAVIITLAFSVIALCACGGGQPRVFKVAINQSVLEALSTTCYRSGQAPTDTTTNTNGFVGRVWTIWDGVDNKQYLDIGTGTWQLGQANPIQVGGVGIAALSQVIEGGGKVFTESKQINRTTTNETDVRSVTVTFDEAPGATAKGIINLKSTYTCASCGQPSCEANLPFTGRKLDGEQTIIYTGP
jgi:hypothetical protein